MKVKSLFGLLLFLGSLAFHGAMARTVEDSLNELNKAVNTAIATSQSVGIAGLVHKVEECYGEGNYSPYYCFYLDYAGRILDAQASAAENFPPTEFFSDGEFGPRVSAVLPKLDIDKSDYNSYLQKVATAINQSINKKKGAQSASEGRKQAQADSRESNYVKKGATVCLNADTILAQAMAGAFAKNAGVGAGNFSTPDDCLVIGRDVKVEIEQKTEIPQVTRVLLDGINKYVFVSTNDLRNHAPVEEITLRKQGPRSEEKPNNPPPAMQHDANYGPKVHACIEPGIAYHTPPRTGSNNPVVKYQVSLGANGEVKDIALMQASGNPDFDRAVGVGIRRCSPFPRPSVGGYEPSVMVDYSMYK